MEKFTTNLSEAETERLTILIEECSEVQQMACKILRHGYSSFNPFDEKQITNRKLLEKELGHLHLIFEIMLNRGDISISKVLEEKNRKANSINQYLHFNKIN